MDSVVNRTDLVSMVVGNIILPAGKEHDFLIVLEPRHHLERVLTQGGGFIHVGEGSPLIFLRPAFAGVTGTVVLYIAAGDISDHGGTIEDE